MAGIFGNLNVSDTERVYQATIGQQVLFDAASDYVNRVNEEINRVMSVFVASTTSNHAQRYMLPSGGYLPRRSSEGEYAAVKASGSWDVAFPLEDFGAKIAGTDVDMAYMTVAELDRHIQSITQRNANTVRYEVLNALMLCTNRTFVDPLWGSLTVRKLANATTGSDTTVYPPVIGSVTEATEDHYLETNYLAAAIDDTHDPWAGTGGNTRNIINEIEEHFGPSAGASEIVSFINIAEAPEVSALTDFEPVSVPQIREGAQTASLMQVPTNLPGVVIGRHRAGAWIVRWDWVPANYILSIHTGVEAPLYMRTDPADTGLGTGLQLIATVDGTPFRESIWRHRFGVGVANRLNGVVLELGTGGTFTDPTLA